MANKRKIINDPVFGFITIPNEFLFDVLQHPFVERLTRIRQMGLSFYVYPGATHTRFLHSIGAMHLMQEAVAGLRMKGIDISHNESIAAYTAILLHDIGHGPFSHVLEHTLIKGISHEQVSLCMMQKINGQMNGQLDLAIKMFTGNYNRRFFHQLISSQLDMDRLDYLCRDAFFCGVSEGMVGSARILKMLDVKDDRLVVEQKGIYSVEKFLVARRLMYWQVYLHKTSVAAEQQLIKILQRAIFLARNGKQLFASPALKFFLYNSINYNDFFSSDEPLSNYALLDDSDILTAIKVWSESDDMVLRLLCEAFQNRLLFKVRQLEKPLSKDEIELLEADYVNRFHISADEARFLYSIHSVSKDTYSPEDDQIDILFRDGTTKDIAEASDMLNLQILTKHVEKHYLFYFV